MVSLRRKKKDTSAKGGRGGAPKRPKVPARERAQQLTAAFKATRKVDPNWPVLVLAADFCGFWQLSQTALSLPGCCCC